MRQAIFYFGSIFVLIVSAFAGNLPSGKIRYQAPEGWEKVTAQSSMRLDEYKLPPKETGEPATLAVFFFPGTGGSVEANLQRWYGQFESPDGKPIQEPEEKKQNVRGIPVTTVYLTGTYLKRRAPMMMAGPVDKKPGYALWAAIAETAEGPWFFKATGPEKTIDDWEKGFSEFVASFEIATEAARAKEKK